MALGAIDLLLLVAFAAALAGFFYPAMLILALYAVAYHRRSRS